MGDPFDSPDDFGTAFDAAAARLHAVTASTW
jgi:hypothetical protein